MKMESQGIQHTDVNSGLGKLSRLQLAGHTKKFLEMDMENCMNIQSDRISTTFDFKTPKRVIIPEADGDVRRDIFGRDNYGIPTDSIKIPDMRVAIFEVTSGENISMNIARSNCSTEEMSI